MHRDWGNKKSTRGGKDSKTDPSVQWEVFHFGDLQMQVSDKKIQKRPLLWTETERKEGGRKSQKKEKKNDSSESTIVVEKGGPTKENGTQRRAEAGD